MLLYIIMPFSRDPRSWCPPSPRGWRTPRAATLKAIADGIGTPDPNPRNSVSWCL